VISVEVKRPGRSTRRRAAVIPIRVRSQSKSDQHTEARAEQKYEGSARRREERRRWSDPVTDLVVTATFVGEGVMTIAHQAGLAAVDMVENVYRMLFDPQTVIAELKRGKLSGYTALLESPPEFYGESRAA